MNSFTPKRNISWNKESCIPPPIYSTQEEIISLSSRAKIKAAHIFHSLMLYFNTHAHFHSSTKIGYLPVQF